MRDGVLLGVERRRRWTDEAKLAILGEVGDHGWTVTDVARRHDVTRQHIYQCRREMRRKGLWPVSDVPVFLPVELERRPELAVQAPLADGEARRPARIELQLANGRCLRFDPALEAATLTQLIRAVRGGCCNLNSRDRWIFRATAA